ncbi:MAG: MBL fold metallo-hydrolase [Acutalibacteraceae bacterium]|nr:MBL fold metallo-hydrolase [Acutalibacteraceae bacterium]
MTDFKLTALKYAESTISDASVMLGGKSDRIWPISFFLFLFETVKRKILVDTGCNELGGFYLSRFIKPIELLSNYGVSAEDITDLIITHSHYDHVALAGEFKNATVYIQEKEYNRCKNCFVPTQNIVTFDNFVKVNDNIKVVYIGGHSIGSSVVEFNLDGKSFVIAGDECYVRECILWNKPTGSSENIENSKKFLKTYGNGKFEIFCSHDMDILPSKNGFLRII